MDKVLRTIVDDYMSRYRKGYPVVDGAGTKRTLFVDIVNLVGDTPGMNTFLDMKGHRSTAFCHRCRFSRSYNRTVKNACLEKPDCALRTASRRTSDRHRTLRASEPPPLVLEKLGMPEAPSETRQALWYWEDSLRATRGTVALTSSGHPVVPSDFDSFQGTAIGFDHVFTGHFKDLMNVAFTFLPTQVYRKSFEKAILSLMRSKHQTTQARLYSAQKQKLMTMSTTQKYSLLPFVASAYSLVIKDVPGVEEGPPEFKEYLELIQRSLASLADLIGAIWRFPKYCNGSQGPQRDSFITTFIPI